MTKSDLVSRALDNVSTPRPAIDPITLLILSAILTTVVEHFTEKCLDRLDAKTVRSPGPITRWRLRRLIENADISSAEASMPRDPASTLADVIECRRKANQLAYDALLKTGQTMSDNEVHAVLEVSA